MLLSPEEQGLYYTRQCQESDQSFVSIARTAPCSCAAVPHAPQVHLHLQNAAHTAGTAPNLQRSRISQSPKFA